MDEVELKESIYALEWRKIEKMRHYCAEAASGGSKIILAACEADIGRDVIVNEIADAAQKRGAKVIRGACTPWNEQPFGAIIDAFSSGGSSFQLLEVSGFVKQKNIYDGVRDYLTNAAKQAPIFILLDNMHISDVESLSLLSHLASTSGLSRVLICAFYRPEDVVEESPTQKALKALVENDRVISIKVEMRRYLDRNYGVEIFGTTLGVRIPSDNLEVITDEDTEALIERFDEMDITELRKKALFVFVISDNDARKMKVEGFFDSIAKKALSGVVMTTKLKVSKPDLTPRAVGNMVQDLIVILRRTLLQVTGKSGKESSVFTIGGRGRYVKNRRPILDARGKPMGELAFTPTLRAAIVHHGVNRNAVGAKVKVGKDDLRIKIKKKRMAGLISVVVDTSGSMEEGVRIEFARSFVKALLIHSYEERNMVSLITCSGDSAKIVLPLTSDLGRAQTYLQKIPFGGTTPLASGILTAAKHMYDRMKRGWLNVPIMVIVTDGSANTPILPGTNIRNEIKHICVGVKEQKIIVLVVDISESGAELAREIAEWSGGNYLYYGIGVTQR